jgi:hypothetical protein
MEEKRKYNRRISGQREKSVVLAMTMPPKVVEGIRSLAEAEQRNISNYISIVLEDHVNNNVIKVVKRNNGQREEGTFTNGSLVSGNITFPNGTIEEGVFSKGSVISGSRKFLNGKIERGNFYKGILAEGVTSWPDGREEKKFID